MPVFEEYLSYQPQKFLRSLNSEKINEARSEEQEEQRYLQALYEFKRNLDSIQKPSSEIIRLRTLVDSAVKRLDKGDGLSYVSFELQKIAHEFAPSERSFEPLGSFMSVLNKQGHHLSQLPLSKSKKELMSAMDEDFKHQMQMLERQFHANGYINNSLMSLLREMQRVQQDNLGIACESYKKLDPLGQCNKKLELLEKFKKDNPALADNYSLELIQKMLQTHKNNLQIVCKSDFFSKTDFLEANEVQKSSNNLNSVISSVSLEGILKDYLIKRTQETENIDGHCVTKQYRHKLFTFMQHSYSDKEEAVSALVEALKGNGQGNLSEHLSTLRNGNLGKELRSFIKMGHADALFENGQKPRTVRDFITALDSQALAQNYSYK
ncbi:hypothetical protein [Legionella cardiaca]|uniref:Uncharacterized protein n=1 Tax=Legionella cardiaca TaxID=1071983 RepID=A0ABY8AW15_9GAMM|nr:hypothetical protein [Legionella cardiaca]WED44366.1 hypothetical protein PXX05_06145 [Legionella cardiaca]